MLRFPDQCRSLLNTVETLPSVPVATDRIRAPAEEFAAQGSAFALSHEADAIGIAPMSPLYVFEGYTINEPWVVILALAHNYEQLKQVPLR